MLLFLQNVERSHFTYPEETLPSFLSLSRTQTKILKCLVIFTFNMNMFYWRVSCYKS